MTVLSSKARVRFQDCDPFQHMNNARYIDYFLNARADQVQQHFGLDLFGGSGFTWVVGSNQIAYFKPVLPNETIVIESEIVYYSEKRIIVEMRMYDETGVELKSFIWVDSIPISIKTQKVEPHAPQLMELFNENLGNIKEESFEERRRNLYHAVKGS